MQCSHMISNTPNKRQKTNVNEWLKNLPPLQTNLPDEWKQLAIKLKKEFCQKRSDAVKRRAFQMALLGILWTEDINIPQIGSFRHNKTIKIIWADYLKAF